MTTSDLTKANLSLTPIIIGAVLILSMIIYHMAGDSTQNVIFKKFHAQGHSVPEWIKIDEKFESGRVYVTYGLGGRTCTAIMDTTKGSELLVTKPRCNI